MADHFGIQLVKGENVKLPGMRRVLIGCGWDPDESRSQHAFDLDVACAMLNESRKMRERSQFIYYGALRSPCGTVVHTGDNLTGVGDGDDERLLIDLEHLPQWVEVIPIIVCIYQAGARRQNFGLISNSYVRIVDISQERDQSMQGPLFQNTSYKGREFCRYDLRETSSTAQGLIFGELYKHQGEWKFRAIEKELHGGFNEVLQSFV